MSYSRHYGENTPEQIIERKREQARLRYETSKSQLDTRAPATTTPAPVSCADTRETGGEGVEISPGPADTDPFTSSEKIPPNDPGQSPGLALSQNPGPSSSQSPALALDETPVLTEEKASVCDEALDTVQEKLVDEAKVVPDSEPAEDQVQALARIHDLVAIMSTFVTTHTPEATAAWKELERDFGPVVPEPEAIPNLQLVGVDDPPSTQKARVIRKLPGNKWLVRPYKLSRAPEGILFLKGREYVKLDWIVWVTPNPFEQQGGYVLQGEYNRYGDRLR